jgi:hypothetical protein
LFERVDNILKSLCIILGFLLGLKDDQISITAPYIGLCTWSRLSLNEACPNYIPYCFPCPTLWYDRLHSRVPVHMLFLIQGVILIGRPYSCRPAPPPTYAYYYLFTWARNLPLSHFAQCLFCCTVTLATSAFTASVLTKQSFPMRYHPTHMVRRGRGHV